MKYKILCPKCKKGMTTKTNLINGVTADHKVIPFYTHALICYTDGIKIISNYPITDGKLPELEILDGD